MSNSKKSQEVLGPIEIKDIKKFQEQATTFKKVNLRILLLDEENKVVYIPVSDISTGSGGSQNLQQTLNNGNETDLSAIFKVTDTDYIKESKISEDGVSVSNNDILSSGTSLVELVSYGFFYSFNDNSLLGLTSGAIDSGENAGNINIFTESGKGNIIVPNELSTGTSITKLPVSDGSPITLATIEDIIEIINMAGEHIPTYADNASAITGGLAVNALYKTATGEIRVRV